MAQVSKALQEKGFEVSILTSEDTIKKFEENGGKINKHDYCAQDSEIDFGRKARFLPALPSQTTYDKSGDIVNDRGLTPFEFIGSDEIREKRNKKIGKAIANENPDVIVTSLWPSGYGPFTEEIWNMMNEARDKNPKCKVYSLSNDIPYIDRQYNYPRTKAPYFNLVDRTFVRGDGTIPVDDYIPINDSARDKIDYVGHFITPLPPRADIPETKRKVLVTYGLTENNWQGNNYYRYFKSILEAAPHTKLSKNPWEVIVSPDCSQKDFEGIQRFAEYITSRHGMTINVRQGVPDKAFKQEVADAAFLIRQYDIFVLDDISTGIPALVTIGEIGRYTCGALEGEDRVANIMYKMRAPVVGYAQYDLESAYSVAGSINDACDKAQRKAFSLPTNAPDRVADAITEDYKAIHPDWSPGVAANVTDSPDPIIKKANKVTPQKKPKNHEKGK